MKEKKNTAAIEYDKLDLKTAVEHLKKAEEKAAALTEENENLIKDAAAAADEAEKLASAAKQAEEYKDKWMRSVAEFDNYKKRNAGLYKDAYTEGKQDILTKVLVVGDNLERALSMEIEEKTKEGIAMLLRQFNEMLTAQGVTEINPVGEVFDPNLCEAVMQAAAGDEGEADTVNAVFQKGYKLGDKIIRYAKVSVLK